MSHLPMIQSSVVNSSFSVKLFLFPSPPVLEFLSSALKEELFCKSKTFSVKNCLCTKRLIVERFEILRLKIDIHLYIIAEMFVQYSNSI